MGRLASGIAGFDQMLEGGLPEGSSVVLQGPPGQEKLLLALTFLAEGLKEGASGLLVLSSQSAESILSELRKLGVDLDAVAKESRLRIVDWYSWSEETVTDVEEHGIILRSSMDLASAGAALSRAIASLGGDKPKRAVVEILSPATNVFELSQVYAFAQSSKRKFDRFSFTSLFILEKEMHIPAALSTLHQPFDGVIEMERVRTGDRIVRKIGVLHLKDTTPEATFLPLVMTDKGFRVIDPNAPAPGRPPGGGAPPVPAPGRKPVVRPPLAEGEAAASRTLRVHLIMDIARERLNQDPTDADALFALAAAQATLGDIRAALESLRRLADLDERYPGLWVLKAKLHARVGEEEEWRQSRMKADEFAEPSAEPAPELVPCPVCQKSMAREASLCPHCGSRTETELDIIDELEKLSQDFEITSELEEEDAAVPRALAELEAAIEPTPETPVETGAEKPEAPAVRAAARDAVKRPEKAPAPKGLTNGNVLRRTILRRSARSGGVQGRTNGLTNGLRGRTNGLTNGLGRTNGLTNGLGRTNGLTNGLGHTNGLTNGLRGRTNGLTNGLGRTNGLTNGLGRTNGLTNGLGRTNGLKGRTTKRFLGIPIHSRWQKVAIPVLVAALLILPIFFLWAGPVRTYPIQIDGQFGDWVGVSKVSAASPPILNPDIDITQVAVKDNIDFLSIYLEVQGNALGGGPAPTRITNTFYAFIDSDHSRSTGYQVQGLGADRMIRINTWGGQIVGATLLQFDSTHGPHDWSGWISEAYAIAAGFGNRLEFQVPWVEIASAPTTVYVAFASRSWDGQSDAADVVTTNTNPFVLVSQNTAAPTAVNGNSALIARFTFNAIGGDVRITGINVTFSGSFGPSSISEVDLVDEAGNPIATGPLVGTVHFDLSSFVVSNNGTRSLAVRPRVASADGTTIGALIQDIQDVSVVSAGVAFLGPIRVPASLAYIGFVPPGPHVDGAFGEWRNVVSDPIGDVQPRWSKDVDLTGYEFKGSGGSAYFMASVLGTALNGTMVPVLNTAYVPSSNGTGGNTTAPPPAPMPVNGTDYVRFFLDSDGLPGTGYPIGGIGADYMVEIAGKEGVILSSEALRFSGSSPWEWNWTVMGSAPAAKDLSRIETAIPGVAITNASRAFFEITGWNEAYDASSAPVQVVLGDPTILTSTGTVKWSIGDSTWKSAASLPAAPSPGPQTSGWSDLTVLTNNNTFATATDSTVYKLLSSGTSWTLFLSPPTFIPDQPNSDVVGITSDSANTYYAITQGKIAAPSKVNQVYRYTGTAAGNWPAPVGTFGPVIVVAIRWVSGTGATATLYYLPQALGTQLSRSTDGGATWAAFGTAPPASGAPTNVGLTVDGSGAISVLLSNGTVERSTNAASTWSWVPRTGTNQPSSGWTAIASDADNNLWTITDKYVWGYNIVTKAWTNMTGSLSITGLDSINAMIPSTSANLVTTGGSTKWSGGRSWLSLPALPAPNTAPEGGAGSWTDIVTISANDTYAIETDTTVYKLASGVASWSLFLSPTGNPNSPNSNAIALATDGAGTFYAITRGQQTPTKNNQVYRYTGSSPGTWSFVNSVTYVNIVDLEWVSGSGASATLYYLPQALGTQLSRSTDGGNTWAVLGTAPPASGAPVNVGFTVASGGAISLLLNNGTVERSTNAGTSWTWIPKSPYSPGGSVWVDIASDTSGDLWTITSSYVWKYDLTQSTWTNMSGTMSITGLYAIDLRIPEFGDVVLPIAAAVILPIVLWRRASRMRPSRRRPES